MFNIKKQKEKNDPATMLFQELQFLDVYTSGHSCDIFIGDMEFNSKSLYECVEHIEKSINELKSNIWQKWQQLLGLARLIQNNNAGNEGSLDNLVFLNSVKKSYLLSKVFSQIKDITDELENLFNIDVAEVSDNLIDRFNRKYLEIRLIHNLIMSEIYRKKVIKKYMKVTKTAQVSGPWANLDLPMKERVWDWSEDEEYFQQREDARQQQVRYNPETNQQGFFYVWQDLSRDPYRFEDMKTDSPYKSRHLLTIP